MSVPSPGAELIVNGCHSSGVIDGISTLYQTNIYIYIIKMKGNNKDINKSILTSTE